MQLSVDGVEVASYVADPQLDVRVGPRPYLHPVRTLLGVTVTEALPYDHPWHLGASVTMADVNGFNLWGGRTFVRGEGYTWLEDHGRIVHTGWLPIDAGSGSGFAERLRWEDPEGRALLTERRSIAATPAPRGWRLSFSYALSAPALTILGSPATHGRGEGAGYGGFFWRLAPGEAHAFTERQDGEAAVNGSAEPWVAVTVDDAYTLVFEGLTDADRWFVRTADYPGVCAALAFTEPLTMEAGTTIERQVTVLVADGALDRAEVRAAVER